MNPLYTITDAADVQVLRQALAHYGETHQQAKLIEEMAELTQAIVKFDDGRDCLGHVREECADVFVTLFQLALTIGPDKISHQITTKINRLKSRMQ